MDGRMPSDSPQIPKDLTDESAENLATRAVEATLARAQRTENNIGIQHRKGWGYDDDARGEAVLAPEVSVRHGNHRTGGAPPYSIADDVARDLYAGEAAQLDKTQPTRSERTSQGTPVGFIPPLYPGHARRQYLRATMRALVRFIHRYGYWPSVIELTWSMRAYLPGVRWTLRELIAIGYVERFHRYQYRLTQTAWDALCLVPIEPWSPRPQSTFRSRVMRQLTQALAKSVGWEPTALVAQLRLQGPTPNQRALAAIARAQQRRGIRPGPPMRRKVGRKPHTSGWYDKQMGGKATADDAAVTYRDPQELKRILGT
jgi:hypothetical protein